MNPLIIGVIVAVVVGFGIWGIFYAFTTDEFIADEFLTKEEAINRARSEHPYLPKNIQPTSFAYLKYNGTVDDKVKFIFYRADPFSSAFTAQRSGEIFFDDYHGRYFSSKIKDRFVWVATECVPASCTHYFFDAITGYYVGYFNPCPDCICHHGDKSI